MNDDYLWDGCGKPDTEVRRLEQILGRFRHNRRYSPPNLGRDLAVVRWLTAHRLGAAVAAAFLIVGGVWVAFRSSPPAVSPRAPASARPAWDVARIEGTQKARLARFPASWKLAIGEWLETDSASRVRIQVDGIGAVEVEPNTRLRLIETTSVRHRLELLRGTIHATISAPPRQFFVETPSAVAVDLGCAYTLTVDDRGAGVVKVTSGWVGFELHGRESFVPTGAVCATRLGVGPGTPYFEDTPKAFRAALTTLDFDNLTPEKRAGALDLVITRARKRDAFTLWHLLSRVTEQERAQVYDRLAVLVSPPTGVTRDGVTRLDRKMLDDWWDQMGLGQSWWWRMWERPLPSQAK